MNGKTPKTLTQDEWLNSHKQRFDNLGLSKAQRRARYRDYASSNAGATHGPTMQSAPRALQLSQMKRPTLRYDDERAALLHAMLNPFFACSREGTLPRVPDGTLKHTGVYKFLFNVDVFSDVNGRAFFFYDTSPFRNHAVSQTTSNVVGTDAAFVAQAEYNAYVARTTRAAASLGLMPAWTSNSWSIPTIRAAEVGTTSDDIGFQSTTGVTSLHDIAAAWRPVCGGIKFKYTAKVLDGEGQVAVARWPGALGTPVTANQTLIVDTTSVASSTLVQFEGKGPNFRTVQTLPSAQVLAAREGFAAIWAPDGAEAQAKWRPVHPKPSTVPTNIDGLLQFSDYTVTNVVVLPDPCNGDPDRYYATLDRVSTQNASSALIDFGVIVQPTYGNNQGLYFQDAIPPTQAEFNENNAFAMRDVVNGLNQQDIIIDNNCLIAVFEGCEPSTLLGTMEVALGVEYIADSRVVSTGNGPVLGRVDMSKSQQIDTHHNTIKTLSHTPAVVPAASVSTGSSVFNEMGNIATSIAGAVPKIAAAAESVAPYIEAALVAFAAL